MRGSAQAAWYTAGWTGDGDVSVESGGVFGTGTEVVWLGLCTEVGLWSVFGAVPDA